MKVKRTVTMKVNNLEFRETKNEIISGKYKRTCGEKD